MAISNASLVNNKNTKVMLNINFKRLMQLTVFAIIFYFCFDNGIISEIFKVIDSATINSYGIKNIQTTGLVDLVMLFRATLEFIEVNTFIFTLLKIMFSLMIVLVIFLAFVFAMSRVKTIKNINNYKTYKSITANFGAVYIIESRFLC